MTEKNRFKRFSAAMLCRGALLLSFACAHSHSAPKDLKLDDARVSVSSEKLPNGSVLRIDLDQVPAAVQRVQGKFESDPIPFYRDASDSSKWIAFLPVSFHQKAKRYAVQVEIQASDRSKPRVIKREIEIIEGTYPSEIIKVNKKHVSPGKKDLERIVKEVAELKAIYEKATQEKLWGSDFIMPVNSVITSPYGVKRLYNGKLQSFHQGLDLRAPTGTPVVAPSAGQVVLAKDLFYTGNTVLIDHGFSIYTIYAHMSELKVKVGQKVAPRDLIGLSGSTGRSTGPHLHWGAVIRTVKVNPADLMKVLR